MDLTLEVLDGIDAPSAADVAAFAAGVVVGAALGSVVVILVAT